MKFTKSGSPKAILHTACQEGDVKVVEELLDKGADIEEYNYYQDTPLFSAIRSKNETIVKLLVERGSNINAINRYGKYPIHTAVQCGDVKIFQYLLERGAEIDQKDNHSETPFFYAVKINKGPIVEILIENRIDVNVQDKGGRTALHYAAGYGHLQLVRTLLNAGSEVDLQDDNGQTPLFMTATTNNNRDIIELLLEKGARINIKDHYGNTPLLRAIESANYKSVKCLLNAGACIDDIFTNFYRNCRWNEQFHLLWRNKIMKTKIVLKKYAMKHLIAEIIPVKSVIRVICVFNLCEFKDFGGSFYESCESEVEEMKMKRFGGVSLFDVLRKTVNPSFADNIEVEHFINSGSLKERFPKYAALIKLKFKEAVKRNNLFKFIISNMKLNVSVTETVNMVHLPNELKRQIFCYLTNEELEVLKEVFQDDN